jgi:hypothetical protein
MDISNLGETKFSSSLICVITDEDDSCFSKDCWICYDNDRQDVGPLIQPCQCRGDVSSVHHDCLRRWLVEVGINTPFLIFSSIQFISHPWIIIHDIGQVRISIIL